MGDTHSRGTGRDTLKGVSLSVPPPEGGRCPLCPLLSPFVPLDCPLHKLLPFGHMRSLLVPIRPLANSESTARLNAFFLDSGSTPGLPW
jgi:hypothetical protein